MSAGHVDFYFDYLSGYAYFGWLRVRSLCARKGATLGVHPVLFAGLLNHWGQLGPAEIPPKRAWIADAASGESATSASGTGTPYRSSSCRDWYSINFTVYLFSLTQALYLPLG